MNFWDELYREKEVILGLSPMDGVTDAPFRYMVGKYGDPDILFTEFVNVDALHYATGARRERLLKTLLLVKQGPYEVAQVFGKTPELFVEAAGLIEELGFDGIDINMGCPAHKVEENGCGAGLIRTPELAQEIIKVVKAATKLPVSIKTRIGVVDKSEMEEWISALMEVAPVAISLHGRTLKQMYTGLADWDTIGRAAEIVHKRGGKILGNGDVKSREEALARAKQYGLDGILIGRAAEGNPAIFRGEEEISIEQKLSWAIEHARKYEEIFPDSFMPMRKHLAWYCSGFPGAVELRMKLMQANSAGEVEEIIGSVV